MTIEQRLLAATTTHTPRTTAELALAIDAPIPSVRRSLNRMERDNLIARQLLDGLTAWTLPASESTSTPAPEVNHPLETAPEVPTAPEATPTPDATTAPEATCPKCGAEASGEEVIGEVFGWRMIKRVNGEPRRARQPWCRVCRLASAQAARARRVSELSGGGG